jgi:hypothetical protein
MSDSADVLDLKPEEDATLCRAFLLSDFVTLLPNLLPPEQFRGSDKHVSLTALADILQNLSCNTNWLQSVWKYIASVLPPSETCMKSTNLTPLLAPLSDWCLLPVMCGSSEILFPVGLSSGVLLQTAGFRTDFETTFFKLGVPQPLIKFFNGSQPQSLLTHMCGNCQQPSCVISALDILSKLHIPLENLLDNRQGQQVLKYLSENVQKIRDTPDADRLIRCLPLYITINYKQTALTHQNVYMLPRKVPRDGMESWTREHGYIFLNHDETLNDLLEFLNCQVLSETEAYCSFIFEHFGSLYPGISLLTFVLSKITLPS